MSDETKKPEDDAVTDEQLDGVAGGAGPISAEAPKPTKKAIVDGESTDRKHGQEIDILE